MNNQKRQLFYLLVKKLAMQEQQYGGSTFSSYLDSGWSNTKLVYEEVLFPLLLKSNYIRLIGYKRGWLEQHKDELPEWAELLDSAVYAKGRRRYIKNDQKVIEGLRDYWIQPSFLIKNKENIGFKTIRPAIPVLEVSLSDICAEQLIKGVSIFINTGTPWNGGYESAGKFIRAQTSNDKLYVPIRSLASLRFFGTPAAIEQLVNLVVLEGGLINCIEAHCPAFWSEEFDILCNETLQEAVERLYLLC